MIYLVPVPPTRLDKRNRVLGWERVRPEREALKDLARLVAALKDKGISEVWASDLDKQYATTIAKELNCGVRAEFQLRRFNPGRQTGAPLDKVESILRDLIAKWEKNKDIPIRGGDSFTSFSRRMDKMYGELLAKDSVALVTDLQTIRYWRDRDPHALIRNGNAVAYDKIYLIRKVDAGTT